MKQPALGQRILALRQEKGLTQEELVAQCNISVRTIQRIEAGEVVPRSYTVKTILSALGENLENLKEGIASVDENFNSTEIGSRIFYIKLAWICGLLYFLLGFVEFAVDYARFFENELIVSKALYLSIKFIVLFLYIYFLWGFVFTGSIFKNYLLKIGAFFLIGITILFYGYDMISLYYNGFDLEYVVVIESIFCGIGSFIFGFALLRLLKPMGTLAQIAGGLTITSGVLIALVFMAWLGYFMLIPAVLLQIVLLYKIEAFLKLNVQDSRI